MAFNNTILARTAGAVWGVKLGYATTQAVLQQAAFQTGGLNAVIDDAFNASYGTTSDATVATMVVANLGLTGATAAGAAAFVEAQLAAAPAGHKGSTLAGLVNLFAGLTGDATFGAAATAFNAKVTDAVTYGATSGTQDGTFGAVAVATSFNLGTGLDNMTGTAGDDAFTAFQVGSANTLSSGDSVNGGAGTDSLSADLAAGAGLTTPRTTNVENVIIRVQERASSTGDNNIGDGNAGGTSNTTVTIDAQRMEGVDRWESNNSRADLKIEDVRIPDAEITKQTTIAMVSTDPGNVDFAVYFDQHSLRAFSGSSSSIRLDILDVFAAEKGLAPLLDSPYDAVSFKLDGVTYTLQSQAINDAQDYPELKTALEAEIAKQPALAGVTVSLGSTFQVPGRSETGTSIVLSATNRTFDRGNWIASQGVPPNTLFYTNQDPNTAPNTDLITSTVVLDDVGRGSMGGDLIIGGLSVGETSSSKGVEKFDIILERSSKLQVVASTANTLQEVVVTQGTKTDVYNTTGNAGKPGALTVVGADTVLGSATAANTSNGNAGHEGVSSAIHDRFGFTDVRLINGTAMTGKFTFDAQITQNSLAKYVQVDDTQSAPNGDNTSPPGQKVQRADFIYSGGSNDDSIYVDVNPDLAGSRNIVEVGREDITILVNGGAGNDTINLSLTRTNGAQNGLLGGDEVWYRNQVLNRNVTINAGDGNDVVLTPGAGDKVLLLGAGDDTTWTDNTGTQKAEWVVNSFDQLLPNAVAVARQFNDIRSDANDSYELYKATVQVAFLNAAAGAEELVSKKIVIGFNATTFLTSDLHINQAIKKAINEDPVLKWLLKAVDGPQNTLIINALTDGVRVAENLRITVEATADALQPSELTALNAAWTETFASDGDFDIHQAAQLVTFNTNGDYVAALTNNGAIIDGTDSTTSADNRITPGLGNDVIVLSTTEGGSTNASSNERVIYSGAFGNDTIVNFDVAGNGADLLDFSALGGRGANYQFNVNATAAATLASLAAVADTSIVVQNLDLAVASYNDTAAEVAGLFPDLAGVAATAGRTYVYVAVHPNTNVATVYSVTDPIGASNVTAALVGTIDLAAVAWDPASAVAEITGANFV